VGDRDTPRGRRRLAALGLVLVAAVILYRVATELRVAGPPHYRACVAALERVTVGQPWAETERHLADAVAAGGEREAWDWWAAAGETSLDCYRRDSTSTDPPRHVAGSVWACLILVQPRFAAAIPFAPTDYTWLWVTRDNNVVAETQLVDCLEIERVDDFGAPYGRYGCRPHLVADE
jgi:hypothetical protein